MCFSMLCNTISLSGSSLLPWKFHFWGVLLRGGDQCNYAPCRSRIQCFLKQRKEKTFTLNVFSSPCFRVAFIAATFLISVLKRHANSIEYALTSGNPTTVTLFNLIQRHPILHAGISEPSFFQQGLLFSKPDLKEHGQLLSYLLYQWFLKSRSVCVKVAENHYFIALRR